VTTYLQDIITASHKHTVRHKTEILESDTCGCFYCVTIFHPKDINKWTDDEQTALCPNCGIDSVIGEKSGYPITDLDYLKQMNSYWF
jgi:hypothetical protein